MGQANRGRGKGWVLVACAALAVLSPSAHAQRKVAHAVQEIDGPVSDDEAPKTNGFSIKKVDQKLIEHLADFERFRDKKAWDRAFKALDAFFAASADASSMAPSKDGFWVPVRRKFLHSLLSLSPEGKEAYRLFNDAKARQQWEQALAHETAGDADTIAQLKQTVDQFFITTIGDKAADHLGDALFEAGDYTGAANAWDQILTYCPDTSLPQLRLQMKQATALARSGRWEEFRLLSAAIQEKHAGETVKIAGKQIAVGEQLSALARPTTRPTTNSSIDSVAETSSRIQLPTQDHPAWQMEFLDPALAEKISLQSNQNGWGGQMAPITRVVPSAVTDGKRVYLNWYGILWAVDVETGKLVWWSDHFKKLGEKINELMQWQVEANRFTLTMAGDSLLTVSLNLDKMNNQEPFRLVSIDPATGKRKWSSDTGVLQGWAFIGSPLVVESTIYITAHPKDNQEFHLLALSMDGKMLWESKLGQPQIANNYRGMPVYPIPVLKYSGGMLYVMTNNGAMIAFDTVSRTIDWAFSYARPADPDMNNGRFWNGYPQAETNEPAASAWMRDGMLYFKDHGVKTMFVLDLAVPQLKWKRDIGEDTGIAGFDDKNFYLLSTGPNNTSLNALDAQSGRMLMSSKLPDGSEGLRVLAAGASYLMFVSRGIFEVDTAVADVTRNTHSFRGIDKDSVGGVLLRAGGRLISVSNLAVTAYPVGGGK